MKAVTPLTHNEIVVVLCALDMFAGDYEDRGDTQAATLIRGLYERVLHADRVTLTGEAADQ